MVTPRDGGGDEDKTSLITAASTTPQESIESEQTGVSELNEYRNLEGKPCHKVGSGRTFSYRKRKPSGLNSLFAAPPGVNPHHVSFSSSRRNTDYGTLNMHVKDASMDRVYNSQILNWSIVGGSRLVFVWPQKSRTRGRILRVVAPLMHGAVTTLLCFNAIHLWPGEFLPNSLPSSSPPPQPPVQCNIIEPLWFDTT